MGYARSGSGGPAAVAAVAVAAAAAAAAAEVVLERGVQPDTVGPNRWNNGSTDRKIYRTVGRKLT